MAVYPVGTVRHPKGMPEADEALPAGPFVAAVLRSSVGGKVLVALTGLALVGFVIFHMIGNLKVFQGPDAINGYAYFLKHDLGVLIWIARAGLLTLFVLHLGLALRLILRSRAARPVAYRHPGSVQATTASRTMIGTGAVVGLFVAYHLAHFTFGWAHTATDPDGRSVNYLDLRDAQGRHDVYSMVVAGFGNPAIAGLYVVAQLALFVHLLHGIQSSFQTLGLKNRRFASCIWWLGLILALSVLLGNIVIVVGVNLGWAPPVTGTG